MHERCGDGREDGARRSRSSRRHFFFEKQATIVLYRSAAGQNLGTGIVADSHEHGKWIGDIILGYLSLPNQVEGEKRGSRRREPESHVEECRNAILSRAAANEFRALDLGGGDGNQGTKGLTDRPIH